MNKKWIIGIAIIIVAAGILLSFTVFKNDNNKSEKYEKAVLDKGNIEALVVTSGTLNPVTIVDVGSQVSGRISDIYVDFNSEVKEGQIIATLDPSLFRTRVHQDEANLESAKASLEKAKVMLENSKKQYNRALELFEKEQISYEEKESAETNYFSAKADLQSAEAQLQRAKSQLESSMVDLNYTIIKSPIDGVVIDRAINVGQTVAASFQAPVLFQIANDLTKMQMECYIDEADIGKVKDGQKVKFTVDAFTNENFNGVVTQVRYSPEVVQNVVTYTTIVEVNNRERKLMPGMTATVSIITDTAKDVLRVPNEALRFTPSLPPEEMKEIFVKLREERMAERGVTSQREKAGPKESSQRRQQGSSGFMQMARRKDFGQVWIENEKGQLRPVFIKTGVTDNTYTEIVRGDLKEGQLVITGENSKGENSGSSRGKSPMGMLRR